jgi:hypothetical protein
MGAAAIERRVIICTFGTFLLVYTWRAYRNNNEAGRSAIIKLVLFAGLTLLPSAALIAGVPGWLRLLLEIGPTYYGAFFAYLAMDQFLNDKQYQPIIENKLFIPISVMYTVALGLGILLGNHRTEFTSETSYYNILLQYILSFIDYFIMIYILVNIIRAYQDSFIFSTSDTRILLRCFLCTVCCVIGLIGFVIVELNLLAYMLYNNDVYRYDINRVYNVFRIIASLFLLMSFLLPSPIISRITPSLDRYLDRRRQRDRELIAYMHKVISQIVPSVVLSYDHLHTEDMLIEIGDALSLIRTHFPGKWLSQVGYEAKMIRQLLDRNEPISLPGTYTPRPSRYNEVRYTVALAMHLKQMEATR